MPTIDALLKELDAKGYAQVEFPYPSDGYDLHTYQSYTGDDSDEPEEGRYIMVGQGGNSIWLRDRDAVTEIVRDMRRARTKADEMFITHAVRAGMTWALAHMLGYVVVGPDDAFQLEQDKATLWLRAYHGEPRPDLESDDTEERRLAQMFILLTTPPKSRQARA